jgi:aryl-alcohol dehydrogenase-like predicted oxidoreductase
LAGRRHEVVLATKFGNTFDETLRQVTETNASPVYIRQACESSLRRLNTDYIDLYQFHTNDYDLEQAAAVRDVLEALVEQGKIRAYAWSTDFPERARVFARGQHCAAVQHQMNVLDDAGEMLAVCEAFDLASVNRGPLAMGLLTGKYKAGTKLGEDDVRGGKGPDWMKYFKEGYPSQAWLAKRAAIQEILTSDGRTLAQGALAWLWARSDRTLPIPGFRTVAQVEENCGALRFGPLTVGQMSQVAAILERPVTG